MLKIFFVITVMGITQHVQVLHKPRSMMSIKVMYKEEDFEQMLTQIPTELWFRHDTDVGLVHSATPVHVNLEP